MQRRRTFRGLAVLTGVLLTVGTAHLLAQPTVVIPADLYVDDDNAGKQDGSALHPYRTVQQAIKAAKGNAVIAVADGTYPEYIRVQE